MAGEKQGGLSPWARPFVPYSSAAQRAVRLHDQDFAFVNEEDSGNHEGGDCEPFSKTAFVEISSFASPNMLPAFDDLPKDLKENNVDLLPSISPSAHQRVLSPLPVIDSTLLAWQWPTFESRVVSCGMKCAQESKSTAKSVSSFELCSAFSKSCHPNLVHLNVRDDVRCKLKALPSDNEDDSILDSPCWKGKQADKQRDDLTSPLNLVGYNLPALRTSSEIMDSFQQINLLDSDIMNSGSTLPLQYPSNSTNSVLSELCNGHWKDPDTQSSIGSTFHVNAPPAIPNKRETLSPLGGVNVEAVINVVHELSNLLLQYCLSNADALSATELDGIASAKNNLTSCLRCCGKKESNSYTLHSPYLRQDGIHFSSSK